MIERALPASWHSPSRRRLIMLGAGAAVCALAGLAPQRATAGLKLDVTSGNVQPIPIAISDLRIYVLSGWFGMGPLSSGMSALVPRLQRFGLTTYHDWNDQQIIVAMNLLPVTQKIVIVGFSLGANELGWIEGRIKRRIDLGVAYDPSKQSPLCTRSANGEYVQTVTQYDRLICYYNPNAWIYGGSTYVGDNVEIYTTNTPHMMVQFSEALHQITIAAISKLSEEGHERTAELSKPAARTRR